MIISISIYIDIGFKPVDAQNFFVYHMPLCKWTEHGLSYSEGMLSPKLDTRPVDLPNG
jgi:hypothetical protein